MYQSSGNMESIVISFNFGKLRRIMRIFLFILSTAIVVGLCYILNTKEVLPAPLGKLLSPQEGIWQNAESVNHNFSADLKFDALEGNASVYLDDRLVPHVFVENENDAYFIQGYLHATFRLWQMELQTLAAAGRASEVVGDIALNHDREFRRLGMVYGAENSLKEMEQDPRIKAECDAYTAGVNAYIKSLTQATLPLEYKLLGYYPEEWSNLKSALFLKYMSYDLASHEDDFEMTNAKNYFSPDQFRLLYPLFEDSVDPVIPRGTIFKAPGVHVAAPPTADSLYFSKNDVTAEEYVKADKSNGSNNWAVSGSKTASGYPILCNDPHLGLNLPSLWYEIQISTPEYNAYGVSFPGAPGVIIGFNDSCAFGFTNGGRDVRDYYEIKFKDDSRKEYWFDSTWLPTRFRYERIKIAGKPDLIDTVAYTVFGPVMYDKAWGGKRSSSGKNYAVRWKAHDSSDELLMFYLLNRAHNYQDYTNAVVNLHTPGQNVVFADKSGEIALRAQGEFPAKWRGQGDFIMPGQDSSYMWQAMIPMDETPLQYNPERGFVSSANQYPADTTYPYYLGRDYPTARGLIINRRLHEMNNITIEMMQQMQTDNFNVFGQMMTPVFLNHISTEALTSNARKYLDDLKKWDYRNDYNSRGATVFFHTWQYFQDTVYADEFKNAPQPIMKPLDFTLAEAVLRDTAYVFLDDISTPEVETLSTMVTSALNAAAEECNKLEMTSKMEWGRFKDTRITHLLKLDPLSRLHIPIGGGEHVINAAKPTHGPSWRMIVSLEPQTKAYGVYPGGQSGNPGSKYYDLFVDQWAAGKYFPLWMMKKDQSTDSRVKWTINFSKS